MAAMRDAGVVEAAHGPQSAFPDFQRLAHLEVHGRNARIRSGKSHFGLATPGRVRAPGGPVGPAGDWLADLREEVGGERQFAALAFGHSVARALVRRHNFTGQ